MRPRPRIGVIYRKELLDVLRDRRTLMAMIIVPVVLYPLLMLGFLRAAESEQDRLKTERFVVEVDDQDTLTKLAGAVAVVGQAATEDERLAEFETRVGQTPPEALGPEVQARVAMKIADTPDPLPPRFEVTITYNEVHVRSRAARDRLEDLFDRLRSILTRESVGDLVRVIPGVGKGAVDVILEPVDVRTVSAATDRQRGGWALGQVVPIILVLMTITGAVYPAIDLTAGERERGTLETLMATPVSSLHLITGKFLVVATVSLTAAILNVASVGATMHFGGLTRAFGSQVPVAFPLTVLPIILLCMIPFAVLFSAVLVAVCSFARTFKEAQNYVMPVIIVAMVPAIAVTLPTVQLRGGTLVMPVGNMVLLARELFQQTYTWSQVATVLASTTLYAAAAVAVAAKLFGQEAVLFADSRSYKALLARRHFEPRLLPTASESLLLAALLFPASFYAQSLLASPTMDNFIRMLAVLAIIQFAGMLVALPAAVTWYLKLDLANTFRLRMPPARAWLAVTLLGLSSWAVAHEVFVFQSRLLRPSQALTEFGRQIETQLASAPLAVVVLLLAVVPAVAEELFFRGFLLSGLRSSMHKWSALLLAGLIFGVFHFIVDRVPVTAMLGIVLGYVCWQSNSVLPGMLMHAMHNGMAVLLLRMPELSRRLVGTDPEAVAARHLPSPTIAVTLVLFALGLAVLASLRRPAGLREPDARKETPAPTEPA